MTRVLIGMPIASRYGGSEGMLLTLLRHRAAGDLDPHVLFLADGPLRPAVEALGVPTSFVDPGRFREPWRLAEAVGRIAARCRGGGPDVLLSWLARAHTVLGPAAMLAGLGDRTVIWEHAISWPRPEPLDRVVAALPSRLVIASSRAGSEAHGHLWPHRRGAFVWPGIDAPQAPDPGEVEALRRALALDDAPVVGIVGRLLTWKGQHRVLDAVALLRDRGIDLTLLVVGGEAPAVEPGVEQRLREQAERLGIAGRVRFCGETPEVPAHVALMDVLVSASDHEPFGIVLLEAMALGVPVVAVASGGPTEIVTGDSGVLVPTGAPGELAAALGELLADPGRRGALAAAGRARYEACFTAERMAREIGRRLAEVAS